MAVIERWAQALGYKEHILGIDIPHIYRQVLMAISRLNMLAC
jgi:hypothetical protein